MAKRKAPRNCYWRGPPGHEVLWGNIKVAGQRHRWSLRTRDAETALRRVKARRDELAGEAHYGESRKGYKEAFVAWSEHASHQVGAATAKRYAVSLRQMEPFLVEKFIDQIDKKLVGEIVTARRRAASQATVRRDLTALSSLLSFAEDQDWRDGNPALDRLRKLKERRDPIALPERADIERVVARTPGNLAVMIRVALATGCRQDELVTATPRSLNLRLRQLAVVGKGNKVRVVSLNDEAVAALRFLPARIGGQHLFWHGGDLPYASVSSRFRTIVQGAQKEAREKGVDFRPFRFHDLRHLFAVEYLKSGGSIYDLQGELGHASIKTTEAYLAFLTPEEARIAKSAGSRKVPQVQRSGDAEMA